MVRFIPKSKKYIDEIKNLLRVRDKTDSHKINSLYKVHDKLYKKRTKLVIIRIIFFIALYASILSSITSVMNYFLPTMSGIINTVITTMAIFGTTISIIMIWTLTLSINTYDRDLALIESHILAIYVKHDKTKSEEFDNLLDKIN